MNKQPNEKNIISEASTCTCITSFELENHSTCSLPYDSIQICEFFRFTNKSIRYKKLIEAKKKKETWNNELT